VRALGVTRCGATRTAAMMDEARKRLGLAPVEVQAVEVAGY
jgi:deoxyribose-phosphate aldolase